MILNILNGWSRTVRNPPWIAKLHFCSPIPLSFIQLPSAWHFGSSVLTRNKISLSCLKLLVPHTQTLQAVTMHTYTIWLWSFRKKYHVYSMDRVTNSRTYGPPLSKVAWYQINGAKIVGSNDNSFTLLYNLINRDWVDYSVLWVIALYCTVLYCIVMCDEYRQI